MKAYRAILSLALCAAMLLPSCDSALDVPANREVEKFTTSTTMLTPSETNVDVGTVSKPAQRTITLTNSDTKNTIQIETITLAEGNKGFSLTNLPTLPAKITPGNSLSFGVNFSVKNAGTFQDKIVINNEPLKGIALNGVTNGDITQEVETTDDLSLLKTSGEINFGSVVVGQGKEISFVVMNGAQNKKLLIESLKLDESNGTFSFVNLPAFPFVLDVNETRSFTISYKPVTQGGITTVMTFANTNGTKSVLKVIGSGVPDEKKCYIESVGIDFNGVKPNGSFTFTQRIINDLLSDVRLESLSYEISLDNGLTWQIANPSEFQFALANNPLLPLVIPSATKVGVECAYTSSSLQSGTTYLFRSTARVTNLSTNTIEDIQGMAKVFIP